LATKVRSTAYGRDALGALRDVIADLKSDDAMSPVTVVVPTNVAGIVARRHLAHGLTPEDNGVAGLFFTTLPRLAERIAAPSLASQGRRPATRMVTAAMVRGQLDLNPGVFAQVADHPATARALAQAMTALRDVDDRALASLGATSALVEDVVRLHRSTVADLAADWYTETDLLATATALVGDETHLLAELGSLVLYLPQDLTRAETAFTHALAEAGDVHVVAGLTGNTRADRRVVEAVTALDPTYQPPEPGESPSPATRVIHASDSDDEVRNVVREVVRTLSSVPAHRVAVLYAHRSPYARLLHEHLGAADIVVNGPGVRPVNERGLSRLLLGLLATVRGGFRRAEVFRTLAEVRTTAFDGQPVPLSRWERISREAGVVNGEDWDSRLATYIVSQQHASNDPEAYESKVALAERNRDGATALRAFVQELRLRCAEAAQEPTWAALAQSVRALFHAFAPPEDQWRMPLEEQYAGGVIERALSALTVLDQTGQSPGLEALEEVLAADLEWALPRVGRFGDGVLVAPVTSAIGLDLDVVIVVGLSEDLYPGRLPDDSLLPERIRVHSLGQLPSTRAGTDRQERSLLAAFASAAEVVASFPRGDLRRHTNRLPSRWLLPTLRRLSGNPSLAASEYDHVSSPSFERSPSYAGSLLSTDSLATEQEWRIRAASAGVHLDDPAIAASLAMREGRASAAFTRFDGRLTGSEGLPNFADGTRLLSPTALERYAICPHEYFVSRMLAVAPVKVPEERIDIDALDTGSLVHECFDDLVSEAAAAAQLPGYGAPWTPAQRQRLQEIGETKAAEYEAEGRTGHRLLWARSRALILTSLDRMVEDDNQWRQARDARVLCSELRFGFGGEPAVDIEIDGASVRFRGSADKVDQRRDGTILVTDIKTGRVKQFAELSEQNPVCNGEKLQLPVYAHAARARYGTGSTPVEAMYWFVLRERGRVELPLTSAVQSAYAATVGSLVTAMAAGVFPPRAPEKADFRWTTCVYCNPDGLGHSDVRRRWEAKRLAPELRDYVSVVEPESLMDVAHDEGQGRP